MTRRIIKTLIFFLNHAQGLVKNICMKEQGDTSPPPSFLRSLSISLSFFLSPLSNPHVFNVHNRGSV